MVNDQCLPPRSPGGKKYEVDRNLNRDGVSCYCRVIKSRRELYPDFALIGRALTLLPFAGSMFYWWLPCTKRIFYRAPL